MNRKVFGHLFLFLGLFLTLYALFFIGHNLKKSLWDGRHNFNFVVEQERIYLYSYQPFSQVVNIISLPRNTVIPSAKGYGDYQLGKIASLGEGEGIDGGSLLSMSLTQFFKAPIEGQIICSRADLSKVTALKEGNLWPLAFNLLRGQCQSNFSWWDFLRLAQKMGRLKLNQVRVIQIEETALWQKQTLADQTEVYTLETTLISGFAQKYFTDEKIVAEDLKIVVLNGTDFNGLARTTAELLKNIGVQVVNNQDKNEQNKESVIYFSYPGNEKSYTLSKISQIFRIEKLQLDEEIEADLLLFLGEDFLNNFYLK